MDTILGLVFLIVMGQHIIGMLGGDRLAWWWNQRRRD